MNPTMELVGTVVSEREVLLARRRLGLKLWIETRLAYGDVYGEMCNHVDRHEVLLTGELARRKAAIRRGDRVHVRGAIRFETTEDPGLQLRPRTLEAFVVAEEIEIARGDEVDRNLAFVIGRYFHTLIVGERAPDEPLRFQLQPLEAGELGLEDRSMPTAGLSSYATGELARELEALSDEAIVALRGPIAVFTRRESAMPPRCFALAAERWG